MPELYCSLHSDLYRICEDSAGIPTPPLLFSYHRPNGGTLHVSHLLSTIHRLFCAISSLHAKDVLHLDIKPGNLVLKRSTEPNAPPIPLLIDFNLAHLLTDTEKRCKSYRSGSRQQWYSWRRWCKWYDDGYQPQGDWYYTDIFGMALVAFDVIIGWPQPYRYTDVDTMFREFRASSSQSVVDFLLTHPNHIDTDNVPTAVKKPLKDRTETSRRDLENYRMHMQRLLDEIKDDKHPIQQVVSMLKRATHRDKRHWPETADDCCQQIEQFLRSASS